MYKKHFVKSLITLSLVASLSACVLEGDDGDVGPQGPTGADGAQGDQGPQGQNGQDAPRDLALQVVGRFATGVYGKSAAEIVQFHTTSNSVFAVNADSNQIEVISLTNVPTTEVGSPITDESLTSTAFTFPATVDVLDENQVTETITLGGANSIAIYGDMLAIAVEAESKVEDGAVLFYTLDALGQGTFVKAVKAGALPDMVTFTPDGSMALVANEGEPLSDYSVDPEGTVSVISITDGVPADVASTINFTDDLVFSNDLLDAEDVDTDEERMAIFMAEGVKFAGPEGNTVAKDFEPEYITVSADSSTAYVSLQESNAIAVINLEDMEVEVKGLGFKDWGMFEMDYTNRDEIASFRKLPNVYGMYQPDSIASYQWNGATFIVTANEGDSRDYDAFSEEIRVKDIIDTDELNMLLSTELQALYDATGGDDGLGRLKVTSVLGDADEDGVYEALYAYGGRSFSIYDQNIKQVYDSGHDFGRISSAVLGNDFNSAHTENKGDNRSDDKGGEPEAIDVGEINGRQYAFIGSERSGDLFVYDVTNPFNVSFVTHYNNRDFSTDFELDDDLDDPCDPNEGMNCDEVSLSGDLGPESVKFVPAENSPNGNALLIVGSEVSGTVTVYQVIEQ
ncbi:choice-of-anchor I family protein [Glaciecola sp. 1036]|uniref:choice-of-anchor I family protein n=1 Tax=Alteromonadaceae TaxID=72275 RepID=UPI003D05BB45